MRSLPPETPAADNAAAMKAAAAFEAATKAAAGANGAAVGGSGPIAASGTAAANGPAGAKGAGAVESSAAVNADGPDAAGAAANADGAAASGAPAGDGASQGGAAPASAEVTVPLTPADAPSMYTYDPLERLNRFTYRFNARFDESVFLPVANGYRRVPSPIRAGVHNFFSNLSEVDSVVNYALQLRAGGGIRSLGRFVINSTIGIGGLFDVATRLKLQNPPTGFSATLSTWGMHPGPYLVLPLLGPSTLRDGVGYLGDYGLSYGINVANLYRGDQSWALGTVNAVDQRSNVNFRYYATGSPFEYETIRFLYVRKTLIEDEALHGKRGKPKDRDVAVPAGR